MLNVRAAAASLLTLLAHGVAGEALLAEGNPHTDAGCASCPAQQLDPSALLASPLALALRRQADTSDGVTVHDHAGEKVVVFHFRQPERLNPRALPFSIAILTHVDPAGLVELPTDAFGDAAAARASEDSWFEDYRWSHWLLCEQPTADAPAIHLGWRYTRKAAAPPAPGAPHSFAALIVRPVAEDDAPERASARPLEAELGEIALGVEAPTWLMAMAATFATARSSGA